MDTLIWFLPLHSTISLSYRFKIKLYSFFCFAFLALTVRFLTKRFIGEYQSLMRKLCLYFIVLITFGAFLLNHLAFCVVVYVLYVLKDHFSDLTTTEIDLEIEATPFVLWKTKGHLKFKSSRMAIVCSAFRHALLLLIGGIIVPLIKRCYYTNNIN